MNSSVKGSMQCLDGPPGCHAGERADGGDLHPVGELHDLAEVALVFGGFGLVGGEVVGVVAQRGDLDAAAVEVGADLLDPFVGDVVGVE